MIYRAIQLIQIFLAHGRADERTDGRTKVFQEVLADLKRRNEDRLGQILAAYIYLNEVFQPVMENATTHLLFFLFFRLLFNHALMKMVESGELQRIIG